MSNEDKKQIAVAALKAMFGYDRATAEKHMAPDIKWKSAKSMSTTGGAINSRAELLDLVFNAMPKYYPNGLDDKILHAYCDGDTVIVEFTRKGIVATGKPYDGEYCLVCKFEGDQIKSAQEYCDSLAVMTAMTP